MANSGLVEEQMNQFLESNQFEVIAISPDRNMLFYFFLHVFMV